MEKGPDAFRTISEVADDLDLPQHVLRFWETRFPQIRPLKRGGGRRYYRPDDIELLRGIRHLLYSEGYTIRGVQRILKEQGLRYVQQVWQPGAEPAAPPAPADRGHERDRDEREIAPSGSPAAGKARAGGTLGGLLNLLPSRHGRDEAPESLAPAPPPLRGEDRAREPRPRELPPGQTGPGGGEAVSAHSPDRPGRLVRVEAEAPAGHAARLARHGGERLMPEHVELPFPPLAATPSAAAVEMPPPVAAPKVSAPSAVPAEAWQRPARAEQPRPAPAAAPEPERPPVEPERPPAEPARALAEHPRLSHEDMRRLKATLNELHECRRLLEEAAAPRG